MNEIKEENNCRQCIGANEPYCHVKLDSLVKLQDSTRKLLCLLEDIQSKTISKCSMHNEPYQLTALMKPIPTLSVGPSVVDVTTNKAIKKLETQAKALDTIIIEDEEDDCSIYKRLTRKCHCLNQPEYNDFIIHFNENTKYYTTAFGEIIKNMRILKKFLYMGGDYARHALMFLNEGLSYSTHAEKVNITQGCAHADICNVFDDHSVIVVYISWPCKYENYGDTTTQELAASFVNKLVQLEEGRRYLKYSSKITNDIRKVIRKKSSQLEYDVLESLNETLTIMHPPLTQNTTNATNATYCKPSDKGFGSRIVTALIQYRQYMTLEEVITHLDILNNLSNTENGKTELAMFLPTLLNLFKYMLMEYDTSEMNIIVTNVLNNVVSKNMIKAAKLPKKVVTAETATEPVQMRNKISQFPYKKITKKGSKVNGKSQIYLKSQIQLKSQLKLKSDIDTEWEIYKTKYCKEPNQVIVVPVEEKKRDLSKSCIITL